MRINKLIFKKKHINEYNLIYILTSSFKAFVAGLYSPKNIWIWLETYPATWWHDTNMTQHEIMKTVVQYSFSFGDNNNVQDNTANTISGHVSMLRLCIFNPFAHKLVYRCKTMALEILFCTFKRNFEIHYENFFQVLNSLLI